MPPPPFPLHLEGRYLRAVAAEWHRVNNLQMHGALKAPAFEFTDSEKKLGTWNLGTRTITLSRHLVYRERWGITVEVLRHEMAHQYVHEVLKATDEAAHGPAFREVCTRFAIDDAARGLPSASDADNRLNRRIEKLLALAGSDNRNEAEAAAGEARRLMLVHNLATPPSNYTFRQLGQPVARVPQYWRQLATILAKHFFVEVIWVYNYSVKHDKPLPVLEVCGTPGNVDMAAWVHDWLLDTGARLWRESGGGNATQKARFYAGLMRGFMDRLEESARRSAETGLLWKGDPGVMQYLGRRHGSLRTVRYTVRAGDSHFDEGRARGREIVLNKPVAAAPRGEGRLIGKNG